MAPLHQIAQLHPKPAWTTAKHRLGLTGKNRAAHANDGAPDKHCALFKQWHELGCSSSDDETEMENLKMFALTQLAPQHHQAGGSMHNPSCLHGKTEQNSIANERPTPLVKATKT